VMPARVTAYYVLALALFAHASYEEVMRFLVDGLAWQEGWQHQWEVPTKSAMFKARQRLGSQPLQALYEATARPLGTADTAGVWFAGWRVMSLDGTCVDVPDSAANDEAFGRPGSGRGEGRGGAFPQLRLVGLCEAGTHAITDAALGQCRFGEQTLAKEVLASLQPGMLCLADRGFYSFTLFRQARATGADLVWQVKANWLKLDAEQHLADGSYLARISDSADRARRHGELVRVIDYHVDDGRGESEPYRLLTTIADPEAATAEQLAALYPQRWELETALGELTTHQRGPRVVLRSKDPDGVYQEAYAHLAVHYAIRTLMHEAALSAQLDPDRLSFTRSLRVARGTTGSHPVVRRATLDDAARKAIAEILAGPLPPRRRRSNPRVVKRKMSAYHVKRPEHRASPQPTKDAQDAIVLTK